MENQVQNVQENYHGNDQVEMENQAQNVQENYYGNDQVEMENQAQNVQENYYGNDQVETESTHINNRKIFIGGLNPVTTEKDLTDYFTKFGAIDSVDLKVDHNTGNSKGFAFVVFNAAESIGQVTAAGEHVINNKKVNAQAAKERYGKIFVGGISNEITNEDVKSHFSQFGNVVGVEIPCDKTTLQNKNFCFVIFESELVAKTVLQNPKQIIKNKEVDIKRATAKPNPRYNQRDNQTFFVESNAGPFRQNWSQNFGNQTYGGYGFNNQQGYTVRFDEHCNFYGVNSPNSYIRNDERTASPNYYLAPFGRGTNRGGSRGGRGGTFRGRGNRF